MGTISVGFWQRMVDDMGLEKALEFVRQDGNEPPVGYDAEEPAPGTPAAQEEADPEEGTGAMPTPADEEGGLSVLQLDKDLLAQHQNAAKLRQQRLTAAAAELAKQKSGPSLTERMMALTTAIATPPQQRGFTGMVAHLMPVLQAESQAVRQGKAADAKARADLFARYEDAGIAGDEKTLNTRIKIAQLQDSMRKAKAAEAKALQPTVQLDAQGNKRIVPKYAGLHRPKSEAELADVPLGEDFVVWEGPQAGEIMTKLKP